MNKSMKYNQNGGGLGCCAGGTEKSVHISM